ncbi:UDP binding domain-containing protein [Acinetobacter sp. GSS19]|uniref:UDP binding domain-containing protein n=1 Tax=Acinetobacter sp. GSS19 TaxID=3020716 RepID=UPI00235F7626|nr:UDP binding domain-containing protein [Acinetobacter sp. GSS19]
MKIAVFGATLHAAVMAVLWAETGHQVCWWIENSHDLSILRLDQQFSNLLDQLQQQERLKIIDVDDFPTEMEVYFFAFNPSKQSKAFEIVSQLSRQPMLHPKLMINGSTFGLHGTAKLAETLPKDAWVYLPDMTQEGNPLDNFMNTKEIVVGVDKNNFAETQLRELLRPFFPLQHQYLFMPILDAEFTKLSISGMLATRISYMNDLAKVAEKLNIDIENVRLGMGADNRIGASYLHPGTGFGGENFSRDILTLSETVAKTGVGTRLLQQVWDINEQQKEILFRKLWNYYCCDLKGKTVAIWGAAFKANSSSITNSPIHIMLKAFWAQGVTVKLHDPQALSNIASQYGHRPDLVLCADPYDATRDAHALCLLTAWRSYLSPDYQRLKQLMAHPLLLDGRNIYDPDYVKTQGFAYEGVGRA